MDLLLSALALLIALFGGLGVTCLLAPPRIVKDGVECLGLAILFGAALVSLASFVFGFVVSGLALRLAVTAVCLGLGGIGIGWRCRQSPPVTLAPGGRPGSLAFAGLLLGQAWLVTLASLNQRLGWDGLFVWDIKARAVCLNQGMLPLDLFSDRSRLMLHPYYPLLLPLNEAWLYGWLGRCDQSWAKLIPPLFYLAAVGLLYAAGTRLGGHWLNGLTAAGLLFFVPQVTTGATGVTSGNADFPLAVVYLGAVVYLCDYYGTGDRAAARLVGALGALLPWVKSEGIILWLAVAALAALAAGRRRDWQALAVSVLPGALVVGLWRLFLRLADAPPTRDFLPVTLETLRANTNRARPILEAVVAQMGNVDLWGYIWPGGLVIAALGVLYFRRREYIVLALAVILPLLCYSAIYLFTALPLAWHLSHSLDRLMLHLSLVVVLIVGLAVPRLGAAQASTASPGRVETPGG